MMSQGAQAGSQNTQAGEEGYDVVAEWEQLPEGWSHLDVCDVAVDAKDRVYLLTRGDHPVIVYERDGSFATSWGEELFTNPHGITIGPDGSIYCADIGDHTVRKLTPAGEVLMTLGIPGQATATGYKQGDYRSVVRAGAPFNSPTKVAVLADGRLCVSDGYGNARVHVFSETGELQGSWGAPGEGSGEFRVPHSITAAPDGRLFVCDRENSRIQIFNIDGEVVDNWTGVCRPNNVAFDAGGRAFVAELGLRAGRWPDWPPSEGDEPGSRCSVWDATGRRLFTIGSDDPCAPASFFAAHGICVDSRGDLYVAEVTWSGGARYGLVPDSCHTLQKLTPRRTSAARA